MKQIDAKKSLISLAVAAALGTGNGLAGAGEIIKFKIEDVGSTVAGAYSPVLDGKSGGFRFAPLNPATYLGASLFSGDTGTGEMIWGGAANPTGSFSTGFLFSGAPFVPFTFGNGAIGFIDANPVTGQPELTLTSLDFGGNYAGSVDFVQQPDPGTVQVNWIIDNGDGTYKVSFQWSHEITTAEDPSLAYTAFTGRWILEGTATVVDSGLPRIVVDLYIPGGPTQECVASGGSSVQLDAQVSLFNGAEIASISWTIDGQPAGTGASIMPFLGLGAHSISVTATALTGQTAVATGVVTVQDTEAPELDVAFIDQRSGEPISLIDRPSVHRVVTHYVATDVCDPDPVTEGVGGFATANGEVLKIMGQNDSVVLTTDSLTLRATTTDDSGNSSNGDATLTITD